MDPQLRQFLSRQTEAQTHHMLDEYQKALVANMSVPNPTAFLASLPNSGSQSLDGPTNSLSQSVLKRIRQLEVDGFCREDEIDDRCRDLMSCISEADAIAAVDELQILDRGRIKNVSAYFMGVVKKYKKSNFPGDGGQLHDASYQQQQHSSTASRFPINSSSMSSSASSNTNHSHSQQSGGGINTPDYPPAPPLLPLDLFYGADPEAEYAPEMPTVSNLNNVPCIKMWN